MHTRSGSLFYKILALFILLGLFPAALVSGRLLILNRDLLERGSETWSLPADAIQQVTRALTNEAGVYLLYTLLVTGLTSIFISGGVIGPIRKLQQMVVSFQKGQLDESIDIRTGDEIEDVATNFTQLARDLTQAQLSLEGSIAERAQDVEQRAFQLQIAAQIAQDTAAARDLEDLLNRTVNLIQERFNFYYVGIFLVDDNREYSVLRAATGDAGRAQMERKYRLKMAEVGIVTYVSNTGDMRIVNNVDFDFVYRRESLLPLTRSEAAMPLKIETNVIGVLDVQSKQVNAFSESDVASLQIISDQIAVAIQNARLVEELDSRLSEINFLYQRYTHESWSRQFGGRHASGYEYDMSQVLPSREEFATDQFPTSGAQTITLSERAGEPKSALVAPLKMLDQVVGAIGVERDDSDYQWTPEEIGLIEAISNQVALALDNARLLEETQRRAEQLRLLQEITSAAASHIEATDLLDDIAERIRAGYSLPHCEIILFDPDGEHGTMMADAHEPGITVPSMVGTKISLGDNELITSVINSKESLCVADLKNNHNTADVYDEMEKWGVNSMSIVPLILRGEVIGTIGLYSADPLNFDDIQLLRQISLQTANAVDVARSFERAAQRAEREKTMTDITARMRETLDVETVLRTAVNEIYDSFKLDAVECYLVADRPKDHALVDMLPPDVPQSESKEA